MAPPVEDCLAKVTDKQRLSQVEFILQSVLPASCSPHLFKSILTGALQAAVVYHKEKPVGCAVWHLGLPTNHKFFRFTSVPGKVHLLAMAVLPLYRCKGFGSKLMEAVERSAHKNSMSAIFLMVQVGNTEASRFYSRQQFAEVETVKNYYGRLSPPHAVRMEKSLAN